MTDSHADEHPPPPAGLALDSALRAMIRSPLTDAMGIVVVEADAQRLVGTMPVAGNTQPFGLLHGGASCVLAETLGSIGASLHAASAGRRALGIELNASHHRAAREGLVTGTATPLHLGLTLVSYEIVIEDDAGRRICTARLSCLLVPDPTGAGVPAGVTSAGTGSPA